VSITLTDEEFQLVFDALEFANGGYGLDDIPHLTVLEAKAWKAVQEARRRADHGE
jgi:hypothetical protein